MLFTTYKRPHMSKLIPVFKEGRITAYIFDCPGCGDSHEVAIYPNKNTQGASWLFNGNAKKPTFSPSINVQITRTKSGLPDKICHGWVTDGQITFMADSTHHLRGQKVELPDQEVSTNAVHG